jgi:hypothetical protein
MARANYIALATAVRIFGFLVLLQAPGNLSATDPPFAPVGEYQVKAAFLYNFAKFVEWPAEAFAGPNDPIAICVLGKDPFGHSLDDLVAGRKVEGRSFVVRQISDVRLAAACQILYIAPSENKHLPSLLNEIDTRPVLPVGEADVSGGRGLVINFILENGKVRFEINVDAAEQRKLQISSKLLSLARIVKR